MRLSLALPRLSTRTKNLFQAFLKETIPKDQAVQAPFRKESKRRYVDKNHL
jgi:hypothetical protein